VDEPLLSELPGVRDSNRQVRDKQNDQPPAKNLVGNDEAVFSSVQLASPDEEDTSHVSYPVLNNNERSPG